MKFCENVIKHKEDLEKNFLMLGAFLITIKAENKWQGRWEDFDHFCRDGLKIAEKTAYKLMLIYEKLIVEYKFSPARIAQAGGFTYLDTILPVIKDKESAEHWLVVATESQSREDLRQLVREGKPGAVDSIDCKHPKGETKIIQLKICNKCGDKWEIHEV